MNKEDMAKLVSDELMYIPEVYGDDRQAELRMIYNASRRHGLKIGKTKEETLSFSITVLKKDYPSWSPTYDSSFFKL